MPYYPPAGVGGGGLADPGSNGILARTALNTTSARTITGTANQITVTNGDGVAGNPTLSTPQDIHTGASPTFAGGTMTNDLVFNSGKAVTFKNTANNGTMYLSNTGSTGVNYLGVTNGFGPTADSSYALGTPTLYWSSTYTDRLYLNSTAYIDGGTAGILSVVGAVGIGTAAPTHTLTLPSTSTGIALYNTVDQTTNYERLTFKPVSNVFQINSEQGGTGANRTIRIGLFGASALYLNTSVTLTQGLVQSRLDASWVDSTVHSIGGALSASSGTQIGLLINPVFTQSGTANYTALKINPTETATGSGAKNLIDAQVGSVSKFLVDNAGSLTLADAATIAVGTTTGTKIGTATTQKLGFFNATPVVQQTGDIITALSNLGLVTSGTVTGGITRSVSSISTPTTAGATASTDYVYLVSGTTTLTLPTAVGNTNRYTVKNVDASLTTTIATTSAQTIDGSASATLPVSNTSVDLISNGSNWAII